MKGALALGERVHLNNVRTFYAMGQSMPCLLASEPGARIAIGDDSSLTGTTLYAASGITIGKRVLVGADTKIIDHDGHDVDSYPRPLKNSCEGIPIVVEDDVWIGMDVLVCKGVTIGRGSVIGAKSIVTHDIPPNVLAAGVPAQVIRPLRLDERERTGGKA